MNEPPYITRAELADVVQALRDELKAAVAALTQRLDRHERWLAVLSTAQVVMLLMLIYIVLKLGL
jgi:hypothetical protein